MSEKEWSFPEDAIEVKLKNPNDFLKIKETLTRIGVSATKDKRLYQSCHILHKQEHYFIMHFKEMFMLDGKPSNFDESDKLRRNLIASLLEDWGLLKVLDQSKIENVASMNKIKVIPFKDKGDWQLEAKYNIGVKK